MTTKKVIAVVRLNAGQGAYYDELTRIHLTVRHPQANVYAGMNVSGLRRSVKSGRLRLVQGSFGDEEQSFRIGYRDGQRVLIVSNSYAAAPKAPEREKQQENAASQMTHTKIDEVIEEAPAPVEEAKAESAPKAKAAEAKVEAPTVEEPTVEEPAEEKADDAVSDDSSNDSENETDTTVKKTTRRRRSRKSTK